MNSLVLAVFAATLTCGNVRGGLLGTSTSTQAASTVSTPVDSEAAASHYGWASLGYRGPIAIPDVRPDGTIAETPEVAAARAAHLAALAAARATGHDMDDGQYDPVKYGDHHYDVASNSQDLLNNIIFYENLARHGGKQVQATVSGYPQQKTSVEGEAALAAWQDKMANAAAEGYSYGAPMVGGTSGASSAGGSADGGYSYQAPSVQNMPYFGPLAMLHVLPSGYLADTVDVAAAREKHLKALAEANAAAELWKAKHSSHQPWN